MTSANRNEAANDASAFDPSGLGRPPSAVRTLAEETEQRVLRLLRDRLDRVLPAGVDLGRIRTPDCRRAIQDLADFARRLDRMGARLGAASGGQGSSSVFVTLWYAWNAFEACRSLEDVHNQLKRLDENFAETVRRVHQVFEKPDPADPAGDKVVPQERKADFEMLLDIVTKLFTLRRIAMIAELNDIVGEFCGNWFAAGADGWDALDQKWREWSSD